MKEGGKRNTVNMREEGRENLKVDQLENRPETSTGINQGVSPTGAPKGEDSKKNSTPHRPRTLADFNSFNFDQKPDRLPFTIGNNYYFKSNFVEAEDVSFLESNSTPVSYDLFEAEKISLLESSSTPVTNDKGKTAVGNSKTSFIEGTENHSSKCIQKPNNFDYVQSDAVGNSKSNISKTSIGKKESKQRTKKENRLPELERFMGTKDISQDPLDLSLNVSITTEISKHNKAEVSQHHTKKYSKKYLNAQRKQYLNNQRNPRKKTADSQSNGSLKNQGTFSTESQRNRSEITVQDTYLNIPRNIYLNNHYQGKYSTESQESQTATPETNAYLN